MPYGREKGERLTRETIKAVQEMDITEAEKEMIFQSNARNILRLPI
jgi:predicted TIM-barrel fold metal-dependent hydrolase